MKRILALTFCLVLALTQLAGAADSDKPKKAKKQAKQEAAATQRAVKRSAKVQRNYRTPQVTQSQRRIRSESQLERRNYQVRSNEARRNAANANAQLRARQRNQANQARIRSEQNQNNQLAIARNRNRDRDRDDWDRNRNRDGNRGNWDGNRDGRDRDRRWDGDRNNWNRNSWAEARQHHHWRDRHHRHRDWWRQHYTRFVLFGGGYYYWHNNYWYPAYGYDRGYNTYVYDEPIYGYNQLAPAQVIVNVQVELQRQGYYYGSIDGLIGPMTRSALARYQADHDLYVTRAIDEPTLQALGLV